MQRKVELLKLIDFLEYPPYLLLFNSYNNKRRFQKDFRQIQTEGHIKTVKVGKTVFVFNSSKPTSFNSEKQEILAYFYYKTLLAGLELDKQNKKILTNVGKVFNYEIINSTVRLYNEERTYFATLKNLRNQKISFIDSIKEINIDKDL